MPKRLLVALAVLVPLAACGPDCEKFCRIWTTCPAVSGATGADLAQCVQGCNEVGGDNIAFVNCVTDQGCSGITPPPAGPGHCKIPGAFAGKAP